MEIEPYDPGNAPPPGGSRSMRHRDGSLICPRCGVPLRGMWHDLGVAWPCAACGGQSLNFSQFRRLVPEEGANDIWLAALRNPQKPLERTQCPECRAAMDAVLIPVRGRVAELTVCLLCQRLWLDRQDVPEPAETAPLLPPARRLC